MTPRPSTLEPRLAAAYARVRRALIGRHALRATAASLVLLVACVTAGLALPRDPAIAGARLLVFILGSIVALAVASFALWRETPRWDAWLESLEQHFPGLRSLLRNAIDMEHQAPSARHTSGELADAVRGEAGRRLDASRLADTVPRLEARLPVVAILAASLSLAAASVLAPAMMRAAWSTLWNPASAAPPLTLVVDPGDVTVVPGAALAVRARIEGTALPPRLLGTGPAPEPVLESTADGGHRWRFDLPPVTRPRTYAVRVASLASPLYHISLTGAPRAVSFSSAITSPAYARLPVQVVSGTRGDLSALSGSRAAVEVTFDRDLESLSAAVNGSPAVAWSALTPRRWRGTVTLNGDGAWDLNARAATGEATFRYHLAVIPDAPPVLTVATPEGDLDLPTGQLVPYDAIIQDDLGVSELKLEWRKAASDPWHEESLARFADEPREARSAARWDASPLALLPGESGVFRLVAYDNARPGPRGRATSTEFRLRFPTLTDLYAAIEDHQESVSKQLEKAAEQTREVQKTLDKLQRQPTPQSQGRQGPSFERSEEMKKAAERQQAVAEQVNQAASEMRESLEQAAERQAFQEQLQQKLKEMSEIMKDIQSQEFKDALKRMQEALQKMDRRAMEETLPQLQQQNKDMLQQIERSMELLKQLREEERLEALARRADDLKNRQDELNREHGEQAENQQRQNAPEKSGDPKSEQAPKAGDQSRDALTAKQKQAAEDSRELAKDARESAKTSEQAEAKEKLEDAAQELEQQASEQQEQAGRDSEQGNSQGAQSSGKKASESLSRASNAMRASAQQQQQEQDQRNLAAVRRASQDLVSLSRAAQENTQGQRSPGETADSQTDLAEGVARVADSLSTLSQQTPFLSNKVSESLGRAMQGLQQSGREMSQGGAQRGMQSGRGAASSLNEAVNALRATEASMCKQPGSGTGGKTASQRLGEIGKQQAQLNQRSREIARKMSQQMSMTQGDAAEMRRLADEQRRIKEQLEEVRRDDDAMKSLLGRLDQTQKQMDEVEESIRQGDVGDDIEQKQTQILSRLLDAQRSIHRRDFDPEREAQRAEDIAHASPAALPKDLFRENDRLRQDLLKADADRVPSQYRTLIEAYLRALNGSPK